MRLLRKFLRLLLTSSFICAIMIIQSIKGKEVKNMKKDVMYRANNKAIVGVYFNGGVSFKVYNEVSKKNLVYITKFKSFNEAVNFVEMN